LTLLAPTGERMAFYEAARQYDQQALRAVLNVNSYSSGTSAARAIHHDMSPSSVDSTTIGVYFVGGGAEIIKYTRMSEAR
jgi:hypothetical protein